MWKSVQRLCCYMRTRQWEHNFNFSLQTRQKRTNFLQPIHFIVLYPPHYSQYMNNNAQNVLGSIATTRPLSSPNGTRMGGFWCNVIYTPYAELQEENVAHVLRASSSLHEQFPSAMIKLELNVKHPDVLILTPPWRLLLLLIAGPYWWNYFIAFWSTIWCSTRVYSGATAFQRLYKWLVWYN
jgi:hypothetical protein